MEIDEISLVDKGANQHAMITIAKRAPEEEEMPKLYNESGELLPEDHEFSEGEVVFDESGQGYEWVVEDDQPADDRELETVGKSAFFEDHAPATNDFTKQVMEELSKAFSDDDRDKVIAKALGRVDEIQKALDRQAEIAKSERDLRLTREYISKAAEYDVPVDPKDLGPVLYRMAEQMSYEDCSVIAKCLETANQGIFEETGYRGGGANNDVMEMVEAYASEEIAKAADKPGMPQMVARVFDENPAAYDEFLAAQRTQY